MEKKYYMELAIQDEGSFVKAIMGNGKKLILDYENEEAKQVRVRAPLPDREVLIENLEYWVARGDHSTIEESVDFYIKCREKMVFEQIQEIRKAMKRISRSMQCINIATDELNKHRDGNA